MEFIYASLDKMDDFKVNKDLSVYKVRFFSFSETVIN